MKFYVRQENTSSSAKLKRVDFVMKFNAVHVHQREILSTGLLWEACHSKNWKNE